MTLVTLYTTVCEVTSQFAFFDIICAGIPVFVRANIHLTINNDKNNMIINLLITKYVCTSTINNKGFNLETIICIDMKYNTQTKCPPYHYKVDK